jgi:hypothetical protein
MVRFRVNSNSVFSQHLLISHPAYLPTPGVLMRPSLILSGVFLGVILAHQSPARVSAQPIPQVSPDRVDDVADMPHAPFEELFGWFDDFSWRAFIALNWPALPGAANRGRPDRSKNFGDQDRPRVWETWKARFEVFAPGKPAPTPAPWTSYAGDNPCGNVSNEIKTLSAFSHFHDFNQALFSLKTLANPLVAQNRTYTRYEVRINEMHFDSIVKNKWYAKLPTRSNPGTFQDGSIEVKAAWRILNAHDTDDAKKRFYVTKAMVFDPGATARSRTIVCTEQSVALTGFHIVIKTPVRHQWIWSSFEHVDNVPPVTSEPAKPANVPYSYNSGGPPKDLSPSRRPPAITSSNYVADPNPMQVVRKRKINDYTMNKNRAYWARPEIKNTIWQNYMLVMTQWPSVSRNPTVDNDGTPFPKYFGDNEAPTMLANTTMETYRQESGNCMDCHHAISNVNGMDFVAFMAFDVDDPPQRTIARSSRSSTAGLVETALDNSPTVRALVRLLRQERPKR